MRRITIPEDLFRQQTFKNDTDTPSFYSNLSALSVILVSVALKENVDSGLVFGKIVIIIVSY